MEKSLIQPASISLNDVEYTYRRAKSEPVTALANFSLDIKPGEFMMIVGPSGCGKSTLLKLISGLIEPTKGSILVNRLPASQIRQQGKISFIFQADALLPWRTVRKNVRLPVEISGHASDQTDELLDLVGLSAFANRYPAELSGGMKQRVAIARALNAHPSVLLMDEPFQAVDAITRNRLHEELQRIWLETGVTILFVTHSINEAVYLGNRVCILSSRPGQPVAIREIPFSHPRLITLRHQVKFFQITQEILTVLES